jgi:hypothetical protein
MAVDFGAVVLLGRQFAELIADPAGRGTGVQRGHQPLDQARAERSARGRQRAEAALRYWHDQIRRGPQCMFALPETALPETPPDDTGTGPPTCGLYSPAAGRALARIAGRTGTSPAVVTLAALSAVLAHRTAHRHCMLVSLAGNRGEVRLRDYVGTLVQYGLIFIDVGEAGFDDHVRRVGTASLRAYRHSMFDADELEAVHQAVNRSRGTWFDQDFIFNSLSGHGMSPRGRGLTTASPDETKTMVGSWVPRYIPPGLVHVDLHEVSPALEMGLISGDTRQVPQSELALLLCGVERLLVAAAAGDLDTGQWTQITGVEPVARDGDWRYIDSCWIELSAAQRLVEKALPGAAPRVFAIPGPHGTPLLTAYLIGTGSVRTPEQAHTACMRALPGQHTAMAPGWYVLCAGAPPDPGDPAGWRHQPVLSSGDGRGDQAG